MKAGRVLNILIAVNVFGRARVSYADNLIKTVDGRGTVEPLSYSTSIADAWLVIDELFSRGWYYRVWRSKGHAHCDFLSPGKGPVAGSPSKGAWADTAPHAICLAALKVVDNS